MKIAIGTTILAMGTHAGEPGRIVASVAKGEIEVSPRIDADSPDLFDRKNRVINDVVEVDYEFDDFDTANAAIPAQRKEALSAYGNLVYGTTPAEVTVGPAKVEQVELIEFIGSGFTIRYTIIATESYS